MALGAAGALFVFVREIGLALGFPSDAVSFLQIPTESSLGAPRPILGCVSAEAGRAGMSSPCDGGARGWGTRGPSPVTPLAAAVSEQEGLSFTPIL